MVLIEEQHPIPQQISSYQFKLVGDMTLKQFFQVAAGAIVSLILYSTNLNPAVKWPLIIGSFLIGVAFAFFPVQDRPLSKWITLFVQAIYSPTIFLWKKNYVKPAYFAPEPSADLATAPLSSTRYVQSAANTANSMQGATAVKKTPDGKIEPASSGKPESPIIKTEDIKSGLRSNTQVFPAQGQREININVPTIGGVAVDKTSKVAVFEETNLLNDQASLTPTPLATQNNSKGISAQFSITAAPPEPPQSPNIIVGQTVSDSGGIIANTILEIRDGEGRPVRALRSNKLGHFMIVTPLSNGNYQILAEKDGFGFEPVNITLNGSVIEPIIIKAKEILTL